MSEYNKKQVPSVRFKGFSGEWEEKKLGEITTMNARIGWQNLRTSEFLNSGDYMLITGTDFKDGKIDYSNIHYIERERYDQDKKIQIQKDSILITKDGTLGKVAYVEELLMPATLNAGVFNVRVKENDKVCSLYLFHYLKAPFLLKYADSQSTGGTIKHLNQNVLINFPIPLPKIKEQQKIGTFFKQLDELIDKQARKLELTKQLKKGFLQKMFPKNGATQPEVRFKGFSGDWEEKKLLDNVDKVLDYRGKSPTKFGMEWGKVGYLVLSALNVKNGYIDKSIDAKYGDQELFARWMGDNMLVKGDVLFTTEAPLGNVAQIPDDKGYILNQRIVAFKVSTETDNNFFAQLLRSTIVQNILITNSSGGTAKGIGMKEFAKINAYIPNFLEQQKIGTFFKNLDTLIEKQEKQLELLKETKKGFLQKMFV